METIIKIARSGRLTNKGAMLRHAQENLENIIVDLKKTNNFNKASMADAIKKALKDAQFATKDSIGIMRTQRFAGLYLFDVWCPETMVNFEIVIK